MWTNPAVDVLKVVSSIVVNALDAYEDDPAEYSDWVAGHQSGQCDCHPDRHGSPAGRSGRLGAGRTPARIRSTPAGLGPDGTDSTGGNGLPPL